MSSAAIGMWFATTEVDWNNGPWEAKQARFFASKLKKNEELKMTQDLSASLEARAPHFSHKITIWYYLILDY